MEGGKGHQHWCVFCPIGEWLQNAAPLDSLANGLTGLQALGNCTARSMNHDRHARENALSNRYGRNCFVYVTTTNCSFWVTQWHHSALLSNRLPYTMTLSLPLSSCWDNTAPMPLSLASVSGRNCRWKPGCVKIRAVESRHLRSSNAVSASFVHWNFALLVCSVSR